MTSEVLTGSCAIRVEEVMRLSLTETEADRKHSTQTPDAKFRLYSLFMGFKYTNIASRRQRRPR